jgi:hypothetical protein
MSWQIEMPGTFENVDYGGDADAVALTSDHLYVCVVSPSEE